MNSALPKIALCMIVKNEANFIVDCLKSARAFCHEMIVVDTGSTDDTVRLAKENGAVVHHFDWVGDFSKARNFSMSLAKSEWVLILDADERINATDFKNIIETLRITSLACFDLCQINYTRHKNVLGFVENNLNETGFKEFPGYTVSWLTRLFRADRGYEFVGAVHEHLSLKGKITDGKQLPVNIHHYGLTLSDDKLLAKRNHYLKIGTDKVRLNPTDYKAHHELGIARWETGDLEGACESLKMAIQLKSDSIESGIALGTVFQIQKKYTEAVQVFEKLLEKNPKQPSISAALGGLYLEMGQTQRAITELKRQINLSPDLELGRRWLYQAYLKEHQGNPKTKATVSVCYIVKNEAECLEKSLLSVRTRADEIIVVDTGSSDATKEIAQRHGAKVFDIPWRDDFSYARNESLKRATSEWVLVLDADEVMSEAGWQAIDELLHEPKSPLFYLVQTTYLDASTVLRWHANDLKDPEAKGYHGYCESALVRLFKNTPQIVFNGSVHEHAQHLDPKIQPLMTEIRIHHYGKLKNDDKKKQKSELYHRIGLKKITEMPSEPHAFYELAVQKWEMDEDDEAATYFLKALELDPRHKDAAFGYACLLHQKKRYADALDAFVHLIQDFPDHAEAHLYASSVLIELKKYDVALNMMHKAKELGYANDVSYLMNEGVIYLNTGRFAEARDVYEKAYAINSLFEPLLVNLAVTHLKLKNGERAKEYIRKALLLNPQSPLAGKTAGEIYFECGERDVSLDYFLKAHSISPDDDEIISQVVINAHCLGKAQVVSEFEDKLFNLAKTKNIMPMLGKLVHIYKITRDDAALARMARKVEALEATNGTQKGVCV